MQNEKYCDLETIPEIACQILYRADTSDNLDLQNTFEFVYCTRKRMKRH